MCIQHAWYLQVFGEARVEDLRREDEGLAALGQGFGGNCAGNVWYTVVYDCISRAGNLMYCFVWCIRAQIFEMYISGMMGFRV